MDNMEGLTVTFEQNLLTKNTQQTYMMTDYIEAKSGQSKVAKNTTFRQPMVQE